MAKSVKLAKVEIGLPFGIGKTEWEFVLAERKAAWHLYVELVTRVSIEPLKDDEGSLRETLNSLYSLFASTRQVLREAGPDVGISQESLGGFAISVLNNGLRPFLSKWHPLLSDWEAMRHPDKSPLRHEKEWPQEKELRTELNTLSKELRTYAEALAIIASVNKKP